MCPACLIRAKRHVNSASHVHKRTIIVQIIYVLEKTIYGLIYGMERLFTALKKDYLRLEVISAEYG